MRRRYKFIGRDWSALEPTYVWESVLPVPGDSRHEQVRCTVSWFWATRSK